MRKDFDKKIEASNKHLLNVHGEQFVLNAQMDIHHHHNKTFLEQSQQHEKETVGLIRQTEQNLRDMTNERSKLAAELAALKEKAARAETDNHRQTMYLKKDREMDALIKYRHERDMQKEKGLIEAKNEEIKKTQEELEGINKELEAKEEYQKALQEEAKLKVDLEQAHVDLALLEVEVDEKEFSQKLYEDRKDHEIEERKKLKEKNGDLKKQLEDKEQINRMRI